ncbi:MAG: helicase-associated domain-containing protein [Clostridiales bacterium]|nr:helicase-associated domain-containing protein [Clostridiales bacterium]
MAFDQRVSFLRDLPLGNKDTPESLLHLAFLIGENINKLKDAPKEQIVSILGEYYLATNRFDEIWGSLNSAEREMVSLHVWSGGSTPDFYADEVAKAFGVAENQVSTYYYYSYAWNGLRRYKVRYAGKNSALWLLFPGNNDVELFYSSLRDAVGEMKRTFSQIPKNLVFSTRENRTEDVANIVRFCNSNKLAITKNGILSKPAALKLINFCGYEDYSSEMSTKPDGVKATDDLLVTFPLIVLCTVSGILYVGEGEFVPGSKASSLIGLPYGQFVKKLFDFYLNSKSFDEISVIKGLRTKRGHHPYDARQNIASEMKLCPIGKFLPTKEFEKYLRISNNTFARNEKRLVVGAGKYASNYGVEWSQYESPLIKTILLFFGALGIIDIAWGEGKQDYVDKGHRLPAAFRINPLGAYVLGLADAYEAPAAPKQKAKGGFTVLPDYTIVIPSGPNRSVHELHFERIFTKVSSTGEALIYKLDFETIARATERGVSVDELRKYLSASDKPVPKNVVRALDDWKKQTGRIKIRNVTILECDDATLLEEVIRYKGMGELVGDRIAAAVVVDGNATNKIKKTIEKNKRFCKNAT